VKRVRFYFDLLSPYAWLALREAEPFAERHGISWDMRPVVFAKLLEAHRLVGPAEVEAKRLYTWFDVARLAARAGAPLVGPPAHPFRSLEALRAVCAVRGDEQRLRLARSFADATWSEGADLTRQEDRRCAIASCGHDPTEVERRILEDDVKLELREMTGDAIDRGVFGVPTFEFEGELFWGQDRLPYLGEALDGSAPDSRTEAKKMLAKPSGVRRRHG